MQRFRGMASTELGLKLQEVPVDVLGVWLTPTSDQDKVMESASRDGSFKLYIRNTDGRIVKITRVFVEIENVNIEEITAYDQDQGRGHA